MKKWFPGFYFFFFLNCKQKNNPPRRDGAEFQLFFPRFLIDFLGITTGSYKIVFCPRNLEPSSCITRHSAHVICPRDGKKKSIDDLSGYGLIKINMPIYKPKPSVVSVPTVKQ